MIIRLFRKGAEKICKPRWISQNKMKEENDERDILSREHYVFSDSNLVATELMSMESFIYTSALCT